MTATIEQVQANWADLIALAQGGEEVVITSEGRAIVRLTAVVSEPANSNRQAWLTKLARLREITATGKTVPTTEETLFDLRSERG